MKYKNILITGGAGFIGSHLALQLIKEGYNITVLDNLSQQIHGSDQTSSLYLSIKGKVNFIHGDVRKKSDWEKALANQDAVMHFAAETGTGQSMYEIEKYVDVNIKGTALLLDYLTNTSHNIKKVIIASSRAIYGEGKYTCTRCGDVYPLERSEVNMSKNNFDVTCPLCEGNVSLTATDENSKIHPTSIYGITKQNQEQMVLACCKSLNISAVAFRYQNVYGPGQSLCNPYTGILSIFSTQINNNNNINIFEDGLESRDFVYIDDVVNATILGLKSENTNFEVFNVGSGVPTTVDEVARTLNGFYSNDVEICISGNYRLGDIRHNYADLNKIIKHLNFSPKISFKTGIEKFVQWVIEQKVPVDSYDISILEMKKKGLYK